MENNPTNAKKRNPLWMASLILGVFLQIALAAYVVSVVVGGNQPPLSAGLPTVVVDSSKESPAGSKETGGTSKKSSAGSKESTDASDKECIQSLAHDKVIDASEWHVEPSLFRKLLRRPNKDLTEFEASHNSDDTVVDCLKGFPITRLVLVDTHITRAALNDIATMDHLQDLEIDGIKPTPDDLETLMRLPHLSKLRLTNCDLSDQCVAILSKHHIVELVLDRNPHITDAGLTLLAKSPVTNLALGETAITDHGVKQLSNSAVLRDLLIWKNNISDESLHSLATMKKLALLDLSYTNITDKGLQSFAPIALKKLVLRSCTGLTPKAIKDFKNRNPNCYIATENGTVD
ncbi:MAG: hypothetical protein JST89_00460 [Cyanobacteria bacterium SZAS-4]|nr:hypothetical protein [Cyanobacteria bacterium SZAS-4]